MTRTRLGKLKPKQQKAVTALLTHPTIRQAAEAVGIGERTLHEWLKEPAFQSVYREMRRASFSHSITLTQQYAAMAVNTLGKVMLDPAAQHSAKVAAAATVLRFGRDALELEDLAVRIEAIERSMAVQNGAGAR